jgi:tetratricopeptide (TPR) repeat protein
MHQFLPGYEWQIGIGFLLLLTGAAAGLWSLATLNAAILPLRPELYRIVRNLRYSFWALPRALGNGKAVAVALEFYRDGFAISELGTKDDPNNTESQHDLAIAYERIGTVLVKIGHLSEALASYRDSLAIVTAQVAKNDSNKWHDDLQVIIEEVGGLSYSFLPARDFAQALAASDLAISLAPNMTWVYSNRAHALMFLGRVEEARSVYLKHRGEIAVDDKVWETVILEDFGNFRKAGLTHPLMRVIETALSQ